MKKLNDFENECLFVLTTEILNNFPYDSYSVGNEYITKVVKYSYNHFEERVNLSTLIEILEVTKDYLSRIFRQNVSADVNQFILDIKMKQACYYLKDTNFSSQSNCRTSGV